MKATKRLLIVVALIVFVAVGISLLFTYSDLRYLTDGEKGVPRQEVEDFWGRRVPLSFGFGTLAIVVVLGLMRSSAQEDAEERRGFTGGSRDDRRAGSAVVGNLHRRLTP